MIYQLLTILRHPNEWKPLLVLHKNYSKYKPDPRSINELARTLDDREFCFAALSKVSRSFSVVIRLLPDDLQDAVCVFYLVLRGLDSIEDDTKVDKGTRVALLTDLHNLLDHPHWNVSNIGTDDNYSQLLAHFHKVIACYRTLDPQYQKVIKDICREMGIGMIKYLDREIEETAEYNEYCYYVAGLVGVGLTELFVSSGYENKQLLHNKELQISMGQFLQKTNIIRDVREDLDEERTFWPRQIWGKYVTYLDELKDSEDATSMFALNHMVSDALKLAPNCLKYLQSIRNPGIFQFCAIPQVMAIATLTEVFQNTDVYKKNVKIRKGLAATLFIDAVNFQNTLTIFQQMAESLFAKVSLNDPNVNMHIRNLQAILAVTESNDIHQDQWETSDELNRAAEMSIQAPIKV